jgi:nucleoside-diphosphate-sugar epimerase
VDDLLDEDAELNPLTQYARSKVDSEHAWLADDGLVSTVLRFGTICGISPRTRFDLLVNDVAARAALGQPIELYAPDAWRPYLHVRDAADAVTACLTAPATPVRGLVANVVGENLRKRDLGALVLRVRPQADVRFVDQAPDRRDYRVRGARLAAALGWEPTLGVQDAFVEVAEAVAAGRWADPFDAIHTGVPPVRPLADPTFVSPNQRGAS